MAAMPYQDNILQSSGGDVEFRVIESTLGNGQQQIAADGLNSVIETYKIDWGGLTKLEMQSIRSQLNASLGVDVFTYQPEGSDSTVNWRCVGGYSWSFVNGTEYKISANFVQDFR